MEPLAAKTGLAVDEDSGLTPNAGTAGVEMVRSLSVSRSADPIVVCMHGEVLGEVLSVLANEDGVRLGRRPPGLKGCVWVLDFRKGKASSARYIAPGR
jgi:hypothetical protein